VLAIFEGRFSRLKDERDNLRKAKEALELTSSGQVTVSDEKMGVGLEELTDLKVSLHRQADTPWSGRCSLMH